MSEYIPRDAAIAIIEEKQRELCPVGRYSRHYCYGADRDRFDEWQEIIDAIGVSETADIEEVVRCKDCKHSTLPSGLTQRYGKAGTLTCHNKYSPCNRRNVSENDFCSHGETLENG